MFEAPTTNSLLRRTFSIFGAAFGPFVVLALIVQSPILLLTLLIAFNPPDEASPVALVMTGAVFLVTTCLTMVASAALVYGVFQGLRGERMSLEKCFQLAMSRALPIVALSLLTGLAIGGGTLLCVIPGIIVSCGLFVSAPALMVERKGALESMNRSWELTKGYRVPIFFVAVCLGIIQIVLSLGASLLVYVAPFTGFDAVGQFLVTAFSTALNAVATAVTYHDVRGFREGLGEDELVEMFA